MTDRTDSNRLPPREGDTASSGFFVGPWQVDPTTCRIRLGNRVVKLEPRVMEVLEFLARRPNQVVSRTDLEAGVWGDRVVGYEALGRTVALLRKALEDDPKQPRFIETLSKKGYRLIAPVSHPEDAPVPVSVPGPVSEKPAAVGVRAQLVRIPVVAALLTAVMIGLGALIGAILPEDAPPVSEAPAAPPSIAVLPFDNLSSDPSQSYVADGIADSLITDLTRISGLFVIARHTAFRYRGTSWNARDLARELKVRFILHGSVQREADALRVNARLTDATTNSQLWAERYDGSVEDIFGLQDRITRNVVSTLAVTLSDREDRELASRDTDSLEAYEYFLRGRERYYRFSREDNRAARDFYTKAIEIDPDFARAYAMLALTYRQEVVNGWSEDREQALDSAMRLADQAISLSETVPEAYFVKGLVHRERKEFLDAILASDKAIEIDPNYADGHIVAGSVLYLAGRPEEGLRLVEKAMRLNPHHPHNYQLCQGQALYVMGSYDQAAVAFRQGLERYPQSERLHLWLAATYAQIGEHDRARWQMDQVYSLNPRFSPAFLEQSSAFRYQTDLEKFMAGVRGAMRGDKPDGDSAGNGARP